MGANGVTNNRDRIRDAMKYIVAPLIVAAVVAAIVSMNAAPVAQAVANIRIENLETQQAVLVVAVSKIPLIQGDLRHIRELFDALVSRLASIDGAVAEKALGDAKYHHAH